MSEVQYAEGRGWLRASSIGVVVAVLTAAVMVTLLKVGLSPFPKPPSLKFAEIVLGRPLPLPVGLLFHLSYVTFWSIAFVRYFRHRSLATALALAGALWIGILVVFFPMFGWGFAGLAVSPKLIPASLLPHLLFGLLLWGFNRYLPGGTAARLAPGEESA